jgi:undecaprenyl diphosphate synthase
MADSELYGTETLGPDFNRSELLKAILDYQKRERRYGGLSAGRSEAGPLNGRAKVSEEQLIEAIGVSLR